MTAEHPSPSHLFPITAFTTTTTTEVYTDPNNKLTDSVFKDLESKKRKRLLLEEEGGGGQEQSPPLEKSPRRDDYQGILSYMYIFASYFSNLLQQYKYKKKSNKAF